MTGEEREKVVPEEATELKEGAADMNPGQSEAQPRWISRDLLTIQR